MEVSAIYGIVCVPTQKVYVGSAKVVRIRFAEHRRTLRRGSHFNPPLQNAWNKYGEESFRFDVIEIVEPENLLARESEIIALRRSANRRFGFNINPTGWSRLGLPHSQASKAKMSAALMGNAHRAGMHHSADTKRLMSATQKGRIISADHRRKLAVASTGKSPSSLTRERLSAAHNGRAKPADFGKRVAAAQAFFSPEQVQTIRALAAEGISRREIGRRYNTCHAVVGKALDGHGPYYSTL